jgi:hypothetical protein
MFGDDHEVFNTETAEPPTIEPRFDSHDVSGLKNCRSRRIYEGFFMNHQSHTMPSSVGEILLKARLEEYFSAGSVYLGHLNTWSTRTYPRLLRCSYGLVPLGLFRTHGTDNKRPSHI